MKTIYQHFVAILILISGLQINLNGQVNITVTPAGQDNCSPLTVNFSHDGSYPTGTKYQWKINEDFYETELISFDSIFTKQGYYQISMEVYDAQGNYLNSSNSTAFNVEGSSQFFEFSAGENICPGQEFNVFTNDQHDSIKWVFPNQDIREGNWANYRFENEGTYSVTMIMNQNICADTISQNINVSSSIVPNVDLNYYPEVVCPNDQIKFKTEGKNTSYTWDFGDGNSSIGREVIHHYTASGDYNIALTVSNVCGNTSTQFYPIQVRTNVEANADFSFYSHSETCPNTPIEFHPHGTGVEFLWAFGDGNSSTEHFPLHQYKEAGTYYAKFKITNGCGNTAFAQLGETEYSYKDPVNVYENPDNIPHVDFSRYSRRDNYEQYADTFRIETDGTIAFRNESWNGSMVDYFWVFDTDTIFNNNRVVQHTVGNLSDTIPVRLIGKNNCKGVNSITKTIVISNQFTPEVQVQSTPDTICPNEHVFIYLDGMDPDDSGYTFELSYGDDQSYIPYTPNGDDDDGMLDVKKYTVATEKWEIFYTRVTNNAGNSVVFKDSVFVTSVPHSTFVYVENSTYEGQSPDEMSEGFSFISSITQDSVYYVWFSDTIPDTPVMYQVGTAAGDKGERKYPVSWGNATRDLQGTMTFVSAPDEETYPNITGTYTYTITEGISFTTQTDSHIDREAILNGKTFIDPNNNDENSPIHPLCAGDTVAFSAFGGVAWQWHFGDNSPVKTDSVTYHIYTQAGIYDAFVNVTNGCGEIIPFHTEVHIQNNTQINAWSYTSTNNAILGDSVEFVCEIREDYQNHKVNWDLGDGNVFTGKRFKYKYEKEGSYPIRLFIEGSCSTMEQEHMIHVKDTTPPAKMPIAHAGYELRISANQTGSLNATASTDADGNTNISYYWELPGINLDDASLAQPSFTAPDVIEPTVFVAILTVTDITLGTSSVDIVNILVSPELSIYAGDDIHVSEGDLVYLNALVNGEYSSLSWSTATSETTIINIENPNIQNTKFVAPDVTQDDTITIVLQVDHNQESLTDTLEVFVMDSYSGSTIWVDAQNGNDNNSGTSDLPVQSIQHAINIATSGDQIKVLPGTYYPPPEVNIDIINKDVWIEAVDKEQQTIINAGGSPSCFFISGVTNATGIVGFTIENAINNGIYIENGSPKIEHNIIRNVPNGIVAGDASGSCDAFIFGNIIHACSQTGISAAETGAVQIYHNTLEGNGKGISTGTNTASIINNIIVNSSIVGIEDASPNDISASYNLLFNNTKDTIGNFTYTNFISQNPLFVDPTNNNYQLQASSPAIDAGDPAFGTDDDGSNRDLGAIPFYKQEPKPSYFSYVNWSGDGFDIMEFHIISANIDGVPLSPGDEIGIFDNENLVGAGLVQDNLDGTNGYILTIITSKDQTATTEIDGFFEGNDYIIRVYNHLTEKEAKVTNVSLLEGKTVFTSFEFAKLSIEATENIDFNIKLISGWNIISLPIEPTGISSMQQLMQPLIDNKSLLKVQDQAGNSLENVNNIWTDNIGTIDYRYGYKVKVNQFSELRLSGKPLDIPGIPLNTGWNISGFPTLQPELSNSVLTNLINEESLEKVQNEKGRAIEFLPTINSWFYGFAEFIPGEGYFINVNTPTSLPDGNAQKSTFSGSSLEYFSPAFEGNGIDHMNIYIDINSLKEAKLEVLDEIAVYDQEVCVGVAKISELKGNYLSIPVSSDDPLSSNIDGFTSSNSFSIRIWNKTSDKEFTEIEFDLVKGYENKFEKGGISVIKIHPFKTTSSVNESDISQTWLANPYPNPFSKQTSIEFSLDKAQQVDISIYNLIGVKIKTLTNSKFEKGIHKLEWDRTNQNNEKQSVGIYIIRMETKGQSFVKRVIISD